MELQLKPRTFRLDDADMSRLYAIAVDLWQQNRIAEPERTEALRQLIRGYALPVSPVDSTREAEQATDATTVA